MFYYVPEIIDFNSNEIGLIDSDGKASHNLANVVYGTTSSILSAVKVMIIKGIKKNPEEYGVAVENGKSVTNEQIDNDFKKFNSKSYMGYS